MCRILTDILLTFKWRPSSMWQMNYQISFLLVLAAAMSSAHIGGQAPSQELTHVYCGRSLSRTLAILCFDDISKPLLSSKRADSGMYNAVLSPYYKEQRQEQDMHMGWPWIVPYKARGMAGQKGKRQLIVSECCDKPCSITELLTYC